MRISKSLLLLVPMLLASGSAFAAADPDAAVRADLARWGDIPTDPEGRSAYGLYLAGRSALSRGEAGVGAAYMASVQALAPDQAALREQAFTSALLAGDLDLAASIAPSGEGVSAAVTEAGKLVEAVRTFDSGKAKAAHAMLAASPVGFPHARAGLLVAPWIAAAAQDWDAALQPPPAGADPVATVFARYHRAQLLEIRRRYEDAEVELKVLAGGATGRGLFRIHYGEFLERRDRSDEALALYDAVLAEDADDRNATLARARVMARERPPALPSLDVGAARGLAAAAVAASSERAKEFAVVYLRLSLGLNDSDDTRALLGQVLQEAGLGVASRAALGQIGGDDPGLYAASRLAIAFSLQEADMPEEALAEVGKALAVTPQDARANYVLASLLLERKRYDEALAVLNGPVLNTAGQAADIHFLRGAAYESLGQIPEAEAELWAALADQPDNATILNYLGYLWVDSGTRVQEGAAMIARAAEAMPQDGNIKDSLGWAQYRQAQYIQAVETLEGAVALEPANAEINDHLGDAYWQVGRLREAGFQWTRVLTLDPDAERRASVVGKLAHGLSGPAPISVAINP